MPETLKKTALGHLSVGSRVNLEPSLRLGDELGGHPVSGHVGGIGAVMSVKTVGRSKLVVIRPPQTIHRRIRLYGSVTVDGVSLTIARRTKHIFTVALVPYTLAHTTLKDLTNGSRVNIETDRAAQYNQHI